MLKIKLDKVQKIEEKIDKEAQTNFEEIRTPNAFFCTFETVKASQEVLKLKDITVLGQTLKIKRAKDPSDIMWANRGISRWGRITRAIILLGIIFPAFYGWFYFAFVGVFNWSQFYYYYLRTPGIECQNVEARYPGDNMKQMAFIEAQYWDQSKFFANGS